MILFFIIFILFIEMHTRFVNEGSMYFVDEC